MTETRPPPVKNIRRRTGLTAGRDCLAVVILVFSFGIRLFGQSPAASDLPKTGDNYRIGVGDVLQITVVKQPLLSLDGVRVGNEGMIRLPMLEADIAAACLTEAELISEVTNRYKKYLLNPQVYIAVREFNANPVALVGAVNAPGRFQLQRPTRLLELLTRVNGPAPNAGKIVQIIRSPEANRCGGTSPPANNRTTAESSSEIISYSLAEVLDGRETANPFVQSGDVIRIPEIEIEQAFIIGSVKAAVIINLREPVTLSKAIAMAGGTAPDAKIERVKISRQSPNSLIKTEIIVNLKEINQRRREDVWLQPNDIVDVPGASGTRKFLKDLIRTAIPAITRVPIVIP